MQVWNQIIGPALLWIWIAGWVAAWPFARFVLRLPPKVCREMFWIVVIALGLDLAACVWIWRLHAAGERDWYYALALPELIATVAWICILSSLWESRRDRAGLKRDE